MGVMKLPGWKTCVFLEPSGAQRGPLRDNPSVLIMRQILRGATVGFFVVGKSQGVMNCASAFSASRKIIAIYIYIDFREIRVGQDM